MTIFGEILNLIRAMWPTCYLVKNLICVTIKYLGINGRLNFMGGDRESPVDIAKSNRKRQFFMMIQKHFQPNRRQQNMLI